MLSVADFNRVLEVLQKVVAKVQPCQKVAFTFISPDAKNSIGKVEPGIAPGGLTGADENPLPMPMSEYFTPGIIDTVRSEYFDRFTNKRIRGQKGRASSGIR
jgi:hypothetical protein